MGRTSLAGSAHAGARGDNGREPSVLPGRHGIAVHLAPCAQSGPGLKRDGEPVRFGVPLPEGWCEAPEQLSLVGGDGWAVPAQMRALDRWSDGTIRWVLVDAFARTGADGVTTCRLLLENVSAPIGAPRVRVVEQDGRVVVETGAAQFTLDTTAACIIGVTTPQSGVVLDSTRSGLYINDVDGLPADITFDSLTVTENGPLRAEVSASGCAAGRGHEGLPLAVRLRFEFFAGCGTVRTSLTLTNPNPAGHPGGYWDLGGHGSVLLREVRFTVALRRNEHETRVECSAEPGLAFETVAQPFQLFQESSGGVNWASPAHKNRHGTVPVCSRGYRVVSGRTCRTGFRASPVVALRKGSSTLAVAMPHFWQNFPKTMEVSDDAVSVGLFPSAHRDLHELQGGEQKTHTFVLAFGDDPATSEPLVWCRAPLVASVDHRSTEQHPTDSPLAIGSRDAQAAYQELLNLGIDGSQSFERKRERADEFGWRHFGDLYADHEATRHRESAPLISHYNNQYDAIAGFAVQFTRTGDRRWHSLMSELAAHVTDIDLYHTSKDKAAYSLGHFWHTNHYIDVHTATHRAYPRSRALSGGGPSAEHNYTTGLMLHYFLTGSIQSRDAVIQLGEWVIGMDDGARTPFRWIDSGPTGLASATYSPTYHGPGRGAGNSVNALLDAHRLTGDPKYLAKAETLVRRCIHPADDVEALRLDDPETRWSYTVFLQVLGKYLEYRYERRLVDAEYDYARASLMRYARWMAVHESPYLDRPERLEFPTETWAAQDLRKAAVFEFAARHTADGDERATWLERAEFFFGYAVSTLRASPTRALTRPLVLMLAYGTQRPTIDLSHVTDAEVEPGAFGAPTRFVSYKRRVVRRAALAAAAACATSGLLIAGRLLLAWHG